MCVNNKSFTGSLTIRTFEQRAPGSLLGIYGEQWGYRKRETWLNKKGIEERRGCPLPSPPPSPLLGLPPFLYFLFIQSKRLVPCYFSSCSVNKEIKMGLFRIKRIYFCFNYFQVKSSLSRGDFHSARIASNSARNFAYAAIGIGVGFLVMYIIAMILVFTIVASSN